MNDFRDLKSIAEACKQHQPLRFMRSHGALYIRNDNGIVFDVHQNRSFPDFMAQNKDYADLVLAANPAVVLALIAENDNVTGQRDRYRALLDAAGYQQLDELLGEPVEVAAGVGREAKRLTVNIQSDLDAIDEHAKSIIAERDQLRAEVAGLRTGYEAYERVNAELKAEVARSTEREILQLAEIEGLVSAMNEILRVTPMGVEAFGIAALVLGELSGAAMGKGEQS